MTEEAVGEGRYGTVNGRPVTDGMIAEWNRQAELGPPAGRGRRGRPALNVGGESSTVLQVRIEAELEAALRRAVETTGRSQSEIARQALREHLLQPS